jgi:hypothetical protein
MCFFQNAHTHAHSAGAAKHRPQGRERRRGAALAWAWHAAMHSIAAQVPKRPAAPSLHARRKQADHTAHHALPPSLPIPVPASAPASACTHDPLRMPCICMSVRRACVHPRLVNAFGTVRVFWRGDQRKSISNIVCKFSSLKYTFKEVLKDFKECKNE